MFGYTEFNYSVVLRFS